jgi:glycosyltransferase involved in cell wall biosynthesis
MRKIYFYADHTSQSPANSGVQRVVRGLGNSLHELVDVVYVRWCPDSQALIRLSESQLIHLGQWEGPQVDIKESGVEPIHLDSRDKNELDDCWLLVPEVTHLTFHQEVPTESILMYARRHRMRIAAIVYDVIPLKRDEYLPIRQIHSNYLQHLTLADFLITISFSVAEDIKNFYCNTAKSAQFHLPLIKDALLPHELSGMSRQSFSEPQSDRLTILSIGTVEPRKNQVSLIKAYSKFRQQYPDISCELKIVGNVHSLVLEQINELIANVPGLEVLNFVPDDQVIELYRRAAFTAFPSVEEGYGLPIAESLWLGVPCLCANFGSMAEIASGVGALCIDTRDEDQLYKGLERMILDAELRKSLRNEAATRRLSTWKEYARSVLDHLEDAPGISRAVYWVNSTVAYHGNSGIQRVVRQMAVSLEELGVEQLYVGWDREVGDFRQISEDEQDHLALWNGPTRYTNISLALDLRDAWLIIPELVLPDPNAQQVILAAKKRGMRVAIIFYDLIPVTLTDVYPPEAQAGYHLFFKMISEADLLLPISKTMGRDLWAYYCHHLERLTTIKERIHPLPLAGELRTFSRADSIKINSGPKISILMVGTIEPRKNHLVAIHGFRAAKKILRERNSTIQLKLTFAGSSKDYAQYAEDIIREIRADSDITTVELPTDELLSELYHDSDFTLFPSLLEGFGLPVLESLWHGRPCICSNVGAVAEVAEGGGCLTFEPHDGDKLGEIIARLAEDHEFRKILSTQAVNRPIKSWRAYARDLTWLLRRQQPTFPASLESHFPAWRDASPKSWGGPKLSVCISTYNRAEWLRHSLRQIIASVNLKSEGVEILVVDNTSTDHTPQVMEDFLSQPNLRYHRNTKNVGMLGNLAVTSKLAKGDYVWIVGDDDLIREGAVPRILDIIHNFPRSEIIYLNYAYTHFDRPEELEHVDEIIHKAIPISLPSVSHFCEEVRNFAGYNENLFTSIYACVFRRDHAIAAYTQDTSGTPFSSLMTCIPTSVYVLNHLINRPGYWVSDPYIIVNMNVSWKEWVLLWHLERMPDLFDLAEKQGVSKEMLAPFRRNHCADAVNWSRGVYFSENENLRLLFSMGRLLERCKHIPEFRKQIPALRNLYNIAYIQHLVAEDEWPPSKLFEYFNLLNIEL